MSLGKDLLQFEGTMFLRNISIYLSNNRT